MKCFICDKELKTEEIIWNTLADEWEPCPECLLVISEVFNDLDEEEITSILEFEGVIETPVEEDHFSLDKPA